MRFLRRRAATASVELLQPRRLLARAELLVDVNPEPREIGTTNLITVLGDRLLYSAPVSNLPGLNALISTDGTAGGSYTLTSQAVQLLGATPTKAYFASAGNLLVTDGTPRGTAVIVGPNGNGTLSPFVPNPVVTGFVRGGAEFQGHFYFAGKTTAAGLELWRTDGTQAGTAMVANLNPGAADSAPTGFTVFDGALYFRASTADAGGELWRLGSEGAPARVTDLNPGAASGASGLLAVFKDRLYFAGNDGTTGTELYSSDGTAAGTFRVADITAGSQTVAFGHFRAGDSYLYFRASTPGTLVHRLFRTDGTAAGTVELTPPGGSLPNTSWFSMANIGDRLVFQGDSPQTGIELFTTTGTPDSTQLLLDMNPGAASSFGGFAVAHDGQFYFTGIEADGDAELWRSDGSAGNAAKVADVEPGPTPSYPTRLTSWQGRVAFGTFAAGANRLYAFDPATSVATPNPAGVPNFGSTPRDFGQVGDGVFFSASAPYLAAASLFRYDIETGGLARLGGTTVINPADFRLVGGRVVFTASTPASGQELFVWTEDTGVQLLTDLVPGEGGSDPRELVAVGSRLSFVAKAPGGQTTLYVTDGTAGGTVSLATLDPSLARVRAAGDRAFFAKTTVEHGTELWVTDGTPAGTRLAVDLTAGAGSTVLSASVFAALDGRVVFAATVDGVAGLYASDGTAAGTRKLMEFDVDSGPFSGIANVASARVFFQVNANGMNTVWATDGTLAGTVPVGSFPVQISILSTLREGVLILAGSGNSIALYASDATAAGTKLVRSFDRAAEGLGALELVRETGGGAYLLFGSTGSDSLRRVLRTDGTGDGTMVIDVVEFESYSPATSRVVASTTAGLVFAQNTLTYGEEPALFADDIPPTLAGRGNGGSGYRRAATPPEVRVQFGEALQGAPAPASVQIRDLQTNALIPSTAYTVVYDAATRSLVVRFPGLTGQRPAPSSYRLTVAAGAVRDLADNPNAEATLDFTVWRTGDLNGDFVLNNLDIAPFVQALTDPSGYAARYPGVDLLATGDVNGDGVFNNLDIAPFVALLTQPSPGTATAGAPLPSGGRIADDVGGPVAVGVIQREPKSLRPR
jgi:ELWxxDGT repeat protein